MMKKLLVFLFILPFVACVAQVKVVDKSGKQPGWLNGIQKDYIIVSGSAGNIQDAQQNALNTVKERIVSSVAENVKTKSEMKVEETSNNHNVSAFLEKFASTTSTESGKVPFLQGISLSKVEEFYWEKTEDKKTREVRFNYHLKYPFSDSELKMLVFDFKLRDRELTEQLENLLAMVDKVSSIEEIEKNIGELNVLSDYFMDGRKDKCALGVTRYRSLYSSIELVELESDLGMLKYALRIGNRSIRTTRKPTVKSECARITSTVNNEDNVVIKFDYDNCYEDPENNILVTYRLGNNNVQKKFFFDITADKAAIFVNEPFHFTALDKDDAKVNTATVDITIISKYQAAFTIDKVVLEWKGLPPVIIDGIGASFEGKGNHSLKLNIAQPIQIETTSTNGKAVSMLSGYIHFTTTKTGEKKTFRIYNHNYTTNW